jgi:hypothetical protein
VAACAQNRRQGLIVFWIWIRLWLTLSFWISLGDELKLILIELRNSDKTSWD